MSDYFVIAVIRDDDPFHVATVDADTSAGAISIALNWYANQDGNSLPAGAIILDGDYAETTRRDLQICAVAHAEDMSERAAVLYRAYWADLHAALDVEPADVDSL